MATFFVVWHSQQTVGVSLFTPHVAQGIGSATSSDALSLAIALFATPSANSIPRSELAYIPQANATLASQQDAQQDADAAVASENPAQVPIAAAAENEMENAAMEDGFVIEEFGNTADNPS